MSTKNHIRQSNINKRLSLSAKSINNAAITACKNLCSTSLYQDSTNIALYFACKNELDTQLIMQAASLDQKNIYLPVIQNELLEFFSYTIGDPLIDDRFGIPEPNTFVQSSIDPQALDLIVLPCAAVDQKGNRIGIGGGYYDRTLSFMHHQETHHPALVCLAYQFQVVDLVEPDEWDVKVNMVVTECSIIEF